MVKENNKIFNWQYFLVFFLTFIVTITTIIITYQGLNSKMSELNREMGVVRTEIRTMNHGFEKIEVRLSNIEGKLNISKEWGKF